MLRYKLRTLLIVITLGPPMLAGGLWLTGQWEFWFLLKIASAFAAICAAIIAVTWLACVIGERVVRLLMR